MPVFALELHGNISAISTVSSVGSVKVSSVGSVKVESENRLCRLSFV